MFSPKSRSVINTIACISLIAVAVPTAAMIVLLAMFDGLSASVAKLNAAVDADIYIGIYEIICSTASSSSGQPKDGISRTLSV